jgi:hypothetical protein
MTYFYGQLFLMDTEIRAMFPAAMDVQRRHFFRALVRIAEGPNGPDEAAQQAWESMFDQAAQIMIDAAKRDAEESPAWWIATVTATEPRGPDVAVLTLAPKQPLTYQAGQYVSVQTPHWPRLWRRYSIANAPGRTGCCDCTSGPWPAGWSARPWSTTSVAVTRWCSARPKAS